jgi:hypothetical protein
MWASASSPGRCEDCSAPNLSQDILRVPLDDCHHFPLASPLFIRFLVSLFIFTLCVHCIFPSRSHLCNVWSHSGMLAHIPFSGVPASGMCPKEMSLRRILLVLPLQIHRKWTTQSKSSPKKQKPTPKRFSFLSSLRNMTPTTGLPYGQRYVHLIPTPTLLTPTVSQRSLGKP